MMWSYLDLVEVALYAFFDVKDKRLHILVRKNKVLINESHVVILFI